MTRGKFITIEGTEGAGKSTALTFIQDYFKTANIPILMTREPGGTVIAEKIRQMLLQLEGEDVMRSETELLLMFAARSQLIRNVIRPTLDAGKWVISDRYVDASYAYQGGGRGINASQISMLDKFVVGNSYPDLTLLLDIPVDLGAARAESRGMLKDRIEQEKIDFFVRVREAYLQRAEAEPERIKIIDASQELAQVQAQILTVLNEFVASSAS